MASHALEIARPVGWTRQVSLRVLDEARVEFEGGAIANSAALASALGQSRGAHLFAVTIGPRLDERVTDGITLEEAAGTVQAHPAHLVRAFGAAFGIAPHQYLMSRRVERARRLLLDGMRPGEAAAVAGFYDQAHLTRHFRRWVGVTPGRYRNGRPPRPASDG